MFGQVGIYVGKILGGPSRLIYRPAVVESRTGHQSQDRQSSRPHRSALAGQASLNSFRKRLHAPACGGDGRFETETTHNLFQHRVAAGLGGQVRGHFHAVRIIEVDALQAPQAGSEGGCEIDRRLDDDVYVASIRTTCTGVPKKVMTPLPLRAE
jgi:hypothetical protein